MHFGQNSMQVLKERGTIPTSNPMTDLLYDCGEKSAGPKFQSNCQDLLVQNLGSQVILSSSVFWLWFL